MGTGLFARLPAPLRAGRERLSRQAHWCKQNRPGHSHQALPSLAQERWAGTPSPGPALTAVSGVKEQIFWALFVASV